MTEFNDGQCFQYKTKHQNVLVMKEAALTRKSVCTYLLVHIAAH